MDFNPPVTDGLRVRYLTASERETLGDLLIGLTDKAIASRRNLTVRGVQNRLDTLATKLLGRQRKQQWQGGELYNLRVRIICEALKRGILTIDDIYERETQLHFWMTSVSTSVS